MMELTSRERVARIFKREPVDRIAVYEGFWPDTVKKWTSEGHIKEDDILDDHFGLDMQGLWPLNVVAKLNHEEEIVEETDETKLVRDGNGALLRWWKDKSGTPEHVDFLVKDRATWEEEIRPYLVDENLYRDRINFEGYRKMKQKCEKKDLFFYAAGINVFECMHPVCGHEYMLMGMALDPDWVKDMVHVYADLTMNLLEILFAEEGQPDGIWYFEDMGFKEKPFMSPAMYKEIVWPGHKQTFDYAKSMGLPVMVHSCGFIEPLVPGLIEAGMDCLQAMEVKAGMDVVRLKQKYGDVLSFMGGMDIRTLVTNDRDAIEAELQSKMPIVMEGSGYMLHSDHSIPDQVEYETYKFFHDRGLELGTYK